MATPSFKVKAIYEYSSEHDDDLKFPIGTIINVTEEEGDDWYVGEYTDNTGAKQEGLFPKNFVEKYEPEIPSRPARAARPKSVVQPPPPPVEEPEEDQQEEEAPPVPAASKPQAVSEDVSPVQASKDAEVSSPPPAATPEPPSAQPEPPVAPKVAPAEQVSSPPPAKKAPPPTAPKSNAFKDRIAAFNKAEQTPLAPIQAGRQAPRNDYVKKPFVAPPPKSSYVPPVQKQEPVRRPYVREEDPEIKARQDQDQQAAEAAGLAGDAPSAAAAEEEEDVPKPMSLKERMALLQEQQRKQAERNAEPTLKKEKKPPVKKPSESSDVAAIPEVGERGGDETRVADARRSLDTPRERPRLPSAQRPVQDPPETAQAQSTEGVLSAGEEADHSAAGETEDDTETIAPEDASEDRQGLGSRAADAPAHEADVGDEEDTAEDAEEEEEVDEEELRKQRLRERMARLAGGGPGAAGGMGMAFNPFGAPAPSAAPKKKSSKQSGEDAAMSSPPQPPRQMVAIPGMGGASSRLQSPESESRQQGITEQPLQQEPEAEQDKDEPAPPPRRSTTEDRGAPPPAPRAERPVPAAPVQERGIPPPLPNDSTRPTPRPPPSEARPLPPPPPSRDSAPLSPGPGSESDDEMSMHAKRSSAETSGIETPLPIRAGGAPPVPTTSSDIPARPLRSPESKRTSYFGGEPSSATSDRRASRVPPPVPGSPLNSPRPPPPPPPTAAPPSRQNTDLRPADLTERGESDYEGDYDTDIASSAKHKDALKSHGRDSSLDDSTTADEMTPVTTPLTAPAPPANVPRAVPPPPPPNAPRSRASMDAPRAAPPPVPPPSRAQPDEDEYDPYRYNEASRAVPPVPISQASTFAAPLDTADEQGESSADDVVSNLPLTRKSTERAPPPPPSSQAPPQDRAPPMPPAPQQAPPPARAAPRESLDIPQRTTTMGRRSADLPRPGADAGGQIAQDVDLSHSTQWWTAPQPLPPSLQSRNGVDLLSESEESTKAKRGGRQTITKDIYVLFMDHSQTHFTVQYDSREPSDVNIEQRHEPPPPKLRQDQLEGYWQRFGKAIAESASSAGNSKKDTIIGDGTSYALPLELIRQQSQALLPVGTRAYGALVYSNLANASTQQFDEIRPGDIVTLRNARFEGHHGAMRQKYKIDYGPGHVAVVEEWDGTRRSVRCWEQGREKKGGVRSEKFRLGDLRSGEVRVWRVVGRDWVGWDA